MQILTKTEAKLAFANNEALLINNTAVNGWEEFFPANWGCDVFDSFEFQIKPKVILIAEFEVTEPIRTTPDKGTICYFPDPTNPSLVSQFKWKDIEKFNLLLERGQIHLIEQNAITHSKALIAASGGKYDSEIKIETQQNINEDDINKSTSNAEIIEFNNVNQVTDNITESKIGIGQQVEEHHEQQEILADLIERANNATTPEEANALAKYTLKWTEEQRKPLIDAINTRLVKLNQPTQSLIVQIQNASTVEILNQLEFDVLKCDPFIQPSLNEAVSRRRQELTGCPI